MPNPVRYPAGVSTATKGTPLWNYGANDPTKYITFWEDFASVNSFPVAASGLGSADNETWDIVVTEAGAGNAASAYADVHGGAITLTNDAADNDNIIVQRRSESFLMASGKRAWFAARFKVSDATDSDWIMGLTVTDTTPLAAGGDGVTDGVFFQKDDGDTDVDFYIQKDATTGQLTNTAITTAAASDTFMKLAWYFDGVRYITVWKDDVVVATVDLTSTITTYLPDTELTVSFMIQNGSANARSMTVDYIFAAMER